MSNSSNIKFEPDGVKKGMDSLENIFTQFADTLSELNNYVETMINAGEDSAILGEYGTKLFQIWSANASSFGDFHANFEAWNEVVAIISANNEEFIVQTVDLYRDSGATLNGVKEARKFVSENGRNGDVSSLSESAQKVMSSASSTLSGKSLSWNNKTIPSDAIDSTVPYFVENGKRYIWTDKDGVEHCVFKDADGKVIAEISTYNGQNKYFNSEGKEISHEEYLSMMPGNKSSSSSYSSDLLLDVGQTTNATARIGTAEFDAEFTLKGFSQRGDMTQEQIFSDKDGNLYYYEDGVMKPVNVMTTTYTGSGNATRPSNNYNQQATLTDLENGKTLYFQGENGTYSGTEAADRSYTTTLDTDGPSRTTTGYSVDTADYNTWNRDNYEGKGTTILKPGDDFTSNYDKNAKDMVITSIIDVRNNVSQEATEMQTYLDMNKDALSESQCSELKAQIEIRNNLASQMGKDVTYGAGVTDGAIGDWGTFITAAGDAEGKETVYKTIDGYEETLSNLKSIDEIVGK